MQNETTGSVTMTMFQRYDLIMLLDLTNGNSFANHTMGRTLPGLQSRMKHWGVPSDHLSRKPHREVSLRKALKLNCISFMKLSAKTACRKCTIKCLGSRAKKGSFSVWYMMQCCASSGDPVKVRGSDVMGMRLEQVHFSLNQVHCSLNQVHCSLNQVHCTLDHG